jgi:hypothetical protein
MQVQSTSNTGGWRSYALSVYCILCCRVADLLRTYKAVRLIECYETQLLIFTCAQPHLYLDTVWMPLVQYPGVAEEQGPATALY